MGRPEHVSLWSVPRRSFQRPLERRRSAGMRHLLCGGRGQGVSFFTFFLQRNFIKAKSAPDATIAVGFFDKLWFLVCLVCCANKILLKEKRKKGKKRTTTTTKKTRTNKQKKKNPKDPFTPCPSGSIRASVCREL